MRLKKIIACACIALGLSAGADHAFADRQYYSEPQIMSVGDGDVLVRGIGIRVDELKATIDIMLASAGMVPLPKYNEKIEDGELLFSKRIDDYIKIDGVGDENAIARNVFVIMRPTSNNAIIMKYLVVLGMVAEAVTRLSEDDLGIIYRMITESSKSLGVIKYVEMNGATFSVQTTREAGVIFTISGPTQKSI